MEIRLVKPSDAIGILNIYKPYVLSSAVTFEYNVPSQEEFTERIKHTTTEFPWFVCCEGDSILGYTYASEHRSREAYKWCPKSTIYLSPDAQGKGIAQILYRTLLATLKIQGYFTVYAAIVPPNEKSLRFHRSMGFKSIGVFEKMGNKLGKWYDTEWFQIHLQEHILNPPIPLLISEIKDTTAFTSIMQMANNDLLRNKIGQ